MKILRCDRCGHEEHFTEIAGNEFRNRGFRTLMPFHRKWAGATDVCADCYKQLQELRRENERKVDEARRAVYAEAPTIVVKSGRGTFTMLEWLRQRSPFRR